MGLRPKVTVVLADGHKLVRHGVRLLLEAEPDLDIVGEASDGPGALRLVEKLKPDVLVTCIEIPGLSGFEVTRRVAARSPRTRVVVLSMYRSGDYVLKAVRSGACGYVLKDSGVAELVRAIRKAAAGERYLTPLLSATGIENLIRKARARGRQGLEILTAREREVLQLVVQGLSSAAIGRQLRISPRTADTHRANVIHKLGLHSRMDLIRHALQHGMVGEKRPRPTGRPRRRRRGARRTV